MYNTNIKKTKKKDMLLTIKTLNINKQEYNTSTKTKKKQLGKKVNTKKISIHKQVVNKHVNM